LALTLSVVNRIIRKVAPFLIPLAIAVLLFVAAQDMSLAIISLLSSIGMIACDTFGTLLTVAEARGQDSLAGIGDMGSDFFGKYILAGWSGSVLTHGHGYLGWLAIMPVLITGFFTTRAATRWCRRIGQSEEG
jgi:hypothetical protein